MNNGFCKKHFNTAVHKTGVCFFLFLFLVGFPVSFQAQTPMMDTLLSAFHYRPKPSFDFGTRNSFVQNSRADIWGIKLGVSFHKRVRIYAGYNYMTSDLQAPYAFMGDGKLQEVTLHMKLNYGAVCFEYVYYKTKHWEFSLPLQLGIGESRYQYAYEGTLRNRDGGLIILYEPMVATEYYIFPWLGVEVDVGLRLMLRNNSAINKEFNGPMYAFGLFLAYDELYKALFPHSRLAQQM